MKFWNIVVLFGGLLTVWLQCPGEGRQTDFIDQYHRIVGVRTPIRLREIVPGVRLYAANVYWNEYIEHTGTYRRLILDRGGRKQIITDLNQLRGSIRIRDERSALGYARLRATPKTFTMFRPLEVEIIPYRELAQMPSYGLKTAGNFESDYRGNPGTLSNHQYRIGKFTPPRVRRIAQGFVIQRWTYSNEEGICYVQEFVGKDGAYSRRALKKDMQQIQKSLPDVQWELPDPFGVE